MSSVTSDHYSVTAIYRVRDGGSQFCTLEVVAYAQKNIVQQKTQILNLILLEPLISYHRVPKSTLSIYLAQTRLTAFHFSYTLHNLLNGYAMRHVRRVAH